MSEESMVSSAPSPWLTMENALERLSQHLAWVFLLTLVYVVVSLFAILYGRVDFGFLLAIAVLLALRDVREFCRGAMARMRALSELA